MAMLQPFTEKKAKRGGWKFPHYSLKLVRAHMCTYEADVTTYINPNPNPNPNPNLDK